MTPVIALTPVLRSFDEAKAREFYLDFLGGDLVFEHRADAGAPLYMGLSLGGAALHLSEHFGDATPGAHLRLQVADAAALARTLAAKGYRGARPGAPAEPTPWGTLEVTVSDPFGNRLTFFNPVD